MIILHIDPTTKNTKLFNQHVEDGKQIFVIFYLEGCGPCNATRPEWKKIENVLKDKYKNNDNIVIADVDQELLTEIKYLTTQPKGFPTIRYIADKGKTSEDYEDSSDLNDDEKDRKVDSFVKWINSKIKKQNGGQRRKKTKKRKTNRNKTKTNKNKRKINKKKRTNKK
jgi:thiol-disulfide isomerase/thioredoxin